MINVQTSRNSQLFAVSDEDGYVSLFNSSKKFASSASHQENTGIVSFPIDNPNFSGLNRILSCVCFKWNYVQRMPDFVTGLLITMRSLTSLGSRYAICFVIDLCVCV